MNAAAENLRSADEVSRVPVGQRDLALRGRGVEHADSAGFDQENAVMPGALIEQGLAAVEHLAAAAFDDGFTLGL